MPPAIVGRSHIWMPRDVVPVGEVAHRVARPRGAQLPRLLRDARRTGAGAARALRPHEPREVLLSEPGNLQCRKNFTTLQAYKFNLI